MSYKVLRWRLSLQKEKAERSLIKEGYMYKKFKKRKTERKRVSSQRLPAFPLPADHCADMV